MENKTSLADIDAGRVDAFVSSLRRQEYSGATINEYIGNLKAFASWAVTTGRLLIDPLIVIKKLERRTIGAKRSRRSLTLEEIGALLDATLRRPLHEVVTVRTGRNKGKLIGRVRSDTRKKCDRLGEERQLAYCLALWTGLRRGELAALEWRDIELDSLPPRIILRAETTKASRARHRPAASADRGLA